MELSMMVVMALTVGLVEVVKRMEAVPVRFLPVIALLVGVALAAVGGSAVGLSSWREVIVAGLMAGLSAMGLYSGGKTVLEK